MCAEKQKKTFAENIDFFFNKLLPKKFIVIVIATIMVFKQIDVPEEYWYLLYGFMGGNILQKFTSVLNTKYANQDGKGMGE